MPAQTFSFLAFNRGLVSRLGLARLDIDRVRISASRMRNWVPRVLGSMMLRPGLEYIGSTASNAAARLVPFIFSSTDTAILEFTDSTLRVWRNDALITRVSITSLVSNGDFNTDLASWTDSDESGGSSVWVSPGYMGLAGNGTNAAIRDQQVTVPGGSQNVEHALRVVIQRGPVFLRVGSTQGDDDYVTEASLQTGTHSLTFTPTGSSFWIRLFSRVKRQVLVDSCNLEASGTLSLPSPFLAADLSNIRFDQSGDVIFIACDGYTQRRIVRRSPTSWGIEHYIAYDGPFKTENTGPITLTPFALSGNTTLTASKALFKPTHAPDANNAGALFRVTSAGQRVTQTVTGANQFTSSIKVTGVSSGRVFTVIRAGTWSATVTLQRSLETSTGPWTDVTTYTTNGTVTFDDGLDNQIAWYRIGVKTGEFTSGSIALELNYSGGSIDGLCRITQVVNSTQVLVEVINDFGATTATDSWAEGSWSRKSGWPSAVSFHEGRLSWAGKDKIWMSVSDAFDSFDDNVEGDSGPINRSIGQGPVDRFNWMISLQRLLIGGDGAEWSARSSSLDEPLTPTNFNLKTVGTEGSANVDALKVDDRAVFVQKSGFRVYELSLANDPTAIAYAGIDLTEIVPEIGDPSIVRTDVQRQPDTRMHFVRSDGIAAVLLFDKPENTLCWFEVESDGGSGLIQDVCVLPGTSEEDQVYYVVQRTLPTGTELITNGTFDSDISGWTDISTGTGAGLIGYNSADQRMFIQSTTVATNNIGIATQSFTTSIGGTYNFTFDVFQGQQGGGWVRIGTSSGGAQVLANQLIQPGNSYSFQFTATATTTWVTFEQFGSTFGVRIMDIDNVSVIEQNQVVRYIEKWALESEARGTSLNKQADSFITYEGAATTTITGLSHLEGLEVVVWAQGEDVGTASSTRSAWTFTHTVSGGQITLASAATNVCVGLPYRAQWQSGKLALAASLGAPLTKKKRIHGIGLVLADTHTQGLFFGRDFNNMDQLPLRRKGAKVNPNVVLTDIDDGSIPFPGEWSTDSRLCLEARAPRPCTILAAVVDTELHEQR